MKKLVGGGCHRSHFSISLTLFILITDVSPPLTPTFPSPACPVECVHPPSLTWEPVSPLSHLTSDICSIHPNPTHSGVVDDHDSQPHLDILPPRLTVCLLNMSSHRIMLLHSENENFHKRHRILLFEIFSSKLWDFFCIEKFDFFWYRENKWVG